MVVFSDVGVALPSSFPKLQATSPRLTGAINKRIFTDVLADVTITVDGQPFVLHKFPLVSQSGQLRKIFMETRDSDSPCLELCNVPGGAEAFELAVSFCYGTNFDINAANVVHLRCIAEYLEMAEDYRDDNLISRTESYLNEIVFHSLEKSLQVLCINQGAPLHPIAEELRILDRCAEAIAVCLSKEQLVWSLQDLSRLKIDSFQKVISAMRRIGLRPDTIGASIMSYAQASLKGMESRHQCLDSGAMAGETEQTTIVEALVGIISNEKLASFPISFLFGMLRMTIAVDALLDYKMELEKRIGSQLQMAALDDLLIPSPKARDSSVFDVDTVHRILVNFLQKIEEEEEDDDDTSPPCDGGGGGYESEELSRSPSHGSILKVGRLMDGYFAEIAPDPYLKLQKFMAIIELLPDYARIVDDGLYRAVDIYLKAHPSLTEMECRRLCKLIDCSKLSQEASSHAAQNERLPVQTTVRVLYFEQLRLRSSLSGANNDCLFSSNWLMAAGGGGGSGAPSAAMSPRDNYASLRRENRELRLEVTRIRARLSELEKEQAFMRQQGAREGRSGGDSGRALFASLYRGISGRIWFLGGGGSAQHRSSDRKPQNSLDRRQKHRHRRS